MAKLIITLPNSRDVIHELSGDVVTVGRSADNKIQINHDSVSGHHAKFILTKGRYRLKDLDSTNKTCVNSLPISEAVLTGSCIVRFGSVECMFKEDLTAQGENITTQLAEAQRQITALMRARDALHEQNQSVAKQRDALQISNDDLTDRVSDIESEKNRIAQERDALLARQAELPEKLNQHTEQIQSLQQERDAALQNSEGLSKKLKEIQKQLDAIGAERDQARKQSEESAANLSRQAEQLDAAVKERDSLLHEGKQIRAQLADAETRIASASEASDRTVQETSDVRSEMEALRTELGAAHAAREKSAAQIDKANKRIEELLKKGDLQDGEAAKQLEALKQTNADLASQLDEANSRAEQSGLERDEKVAGIDGRLKETQALLETAQAERNTERSAHVKLTVQLANAEQKADELIQERDSAIAEARKQIEALETERQTAGRTAGELTAQLAEAKEQSAAMCKEQEAAVKAKEKLAAELGGTKQRVDQLLSEREAKLGAVSDELEKARKQIEALETEREIAGRTAGELTAQLAEAKEQAVAIRKEQEAAVKAKEKLAAELGGTKQRVDQLLSEREAKLGAVSDELEKARKQIEALETERENAGRTAGELTAQLAEAKEQSATIRKEQEAAVKAKEKLAAELGGTKQRVDQLLSEREAKLGAVSDELEKARKQIEALETERETAGRTAGELTAQLAEAKEQAAAIRNEQEAANKAKEKLAAELGGTKQKLDDLSCQHEKLQSEAAGKLGESEKRLEALLAELDAVKKSGDQTAARITESERQAEATRAERDAAKQENEKLAAQLAETRKQFDQVVKKGSVETGEISARLDDAQKQIDAIRAERDEAGRANTALASQLDATKKQIDELVRSKGAEVDDIACSLTEAQKKIDAITRERDGMKQTSVRLEAELEEAKQQFHQGLQAREAEIGGKLQETQEKIAALGGERVTLLSRNQELADALETQQKQVEALRETQNALQQAHQKELAAQIEEAKLQTGQLAKERESKTAEIEGKLSETQSQVAALTKQNQELLAELNTHREKLKANESESGAARQTRDGLALQLDEAKRRIEEMAHKHDAASAASAEKYREAKNELEAVRFERATLQQKNEELSERIEAERQQIAAIRAERDAARLAGKRLDVANGDAAHKPQASNARQPIVNPVNGNGSGLPLRLAAEPAKQDFPARAVQAAASAKTEPPTLPSLRLDRKSASTENPVIDEAAVRSILPAVPQTVTIIRSSLQYFIRHQNDHKLVEQLHLSAQKITESTSHIKTHPVHRLAAAIEMMLRDFVKFPEQINGGSLRSLGMGLESLATLLDEKNVFRASHLPAANVFAIDDNADVQREIVSAAKLVKMKVTCADTPTKALSGLGGQPVDLILLDINLPEMSGFDLCTQVRSLPGHLKTPIVFITGAGTPENRAQSLLKGGNDFIAKPFDLGEMNVKTLSWVFKGQLELT